jgi:hypothetical protein
MLNKNPMVFLDEATYFVQYYGDMNAFKQAYVAAREHNNVVDSTEIALEQQQLLDLFRSYLSKE